jgi:glucose/arabinose dehydrogenase
MVPSNVLPVFAVHPPDDPQRLFLLDKAGRIRLIKSGSPTPFLDISDQVFSDEEGGLLGLAFHPDYTNNGRFFLFYTNNSGHIVVSEYARDANNKDLANSTEVRRLIDIKSPSSGYNHNGGTLLFGKDGALYISIGDGVSGGNAQDTQSVFGKILRIDVSSPPAQPLASGPSVTPYIWERGLRNPWRMSIDKTTGDLYIGDVGLKTWEEVNIDVGNKGGKNFEWPVYEGDTCPPVPSANENPPAGDCSQKGTGPIAQYPTSMFTAIVGGHVYRGSAIPCLQGFYIFGSYSNEIRALRWNGSAATDETNLTSDLQSKAQVGALVSFGVDASGEILVVDGTGKIFRIDPE